MLVTGFRTIYRILRLLVPKRIYQQLLGSPSVILRSLWKSKDSPQWGWKKLWDWGTPPTFGGVGLGKEMHIPLPGGAGRPWPRYEYDHVSAAWRRRGRQGRLDVALGRQCGRDAQTVRRCRTGDHISADRYAMEPPRDAHSVADSSLRSRPKNS